MLTRCLIRLHCGFPPDDALKQTKEEADQQAAWTNGGVGEEEEGRPKQKQEARMIDRECALLGRAGWMWRERKECVFRVPDREQSV